MGQKLYSQGKSGIRFTSYRKGEVRIPNYVYDLWMPLLGAVGMGVYAMYCRLEREDVVKAMTQARIAKICRIGTRKLDEVNVMLQDCGFVVITKPEGHKRLMHWTTEIEVFDAPQFVSPELIDKYAPGSGYECMSPWLVTEMLPNISEDVTQQLDEKSGDNANVVSLGLKPLDVASKATPVANAPGDWASGKNWDITQPIDVFIYPEDMTFHCPNPHCDSEVAWTSLKKSKAVCPHCGQHLSGIEYGGKMPIYKPPKMIRKKKVLGNLLPNIAESYAYLPYYANDAARLKLMLDKHSDLLYNCLYWAVGKVADSKMPEYKAVGAALSLVEKKLRAKAAVATDTSVQDVIKGTNYTAEEMERIAKWAERELK